MKIYNKLVRDKIPEVIEKAGKSSKIRMLGDEEYQQELFRKMIEEAIELSKTRNEEQVIEELADIYEVLETILIHKKIDIRKVQKRRVQKNIAKGAFENRVFLECVEDKK